MNRLRRLLFASVHGYVDPASGAACATRDVLGLLAARGVECRVASMGALPPASSRPMAELLGSIGAAASPEPWPDLGPTASGWAFDLDGVGVRLLRTRSNRVGESPDEVESLALLRLVERELARFRPQVVLTYGGHPACLALMAAARRGGVPAAFHLHNLAYPDRGAFADARALVVPSEFCRRYYARSLSVEAAVLPSSVVTDRVVAADRSPRFVAFVNPEPAKGAAVFARVAAELAARRPDVPLMVVEGRGTFDDLAAVAPDPAALRDVRVAANAPDPRPIYREARAVLVPSLVRETFGRVAVEAMANGVPVLASDRGALPETLGDAGFLFALPETLAPDSRVAPTAREVAPWVATIERLWDDPDFEARHRALALREAERWPPDAVARLYLDFFESIAVPA